MEKHAHYIVVVKNNQRWPARSNHCLKPPTPACTTGRLAQNITLDKDHGRLETRRCVVTRDLSPIGHQVQAWAGLKSVVMIESTREFINGREKSKSSTE